MDWKDAQAARIIEIQSLSDRERSCAYVINNIGAHNAPQITNVLNDHCSPFHLMGDKFNTAFDRLATRRAMMLY